jgi:hypothetical protein
MQSAPTRAGRVLAACLLIVLRPQHSPGRQIDEMQLRAGDASDGFVAVRIGRELIRRPALHKLACIRAMIEKCDHPQFNSTRVAAFLALAQMQSEPFPNESPVP